MTGVSFRIDGMEQALNKLAALTRATGDATPAMDEIGRTVVDHTVGRFERGISPDGDPWEQSQRAKRVGGQTLVEQGHLRDSNTHRPAAAKVEVGNPLVYARIHQFGGAIGREGGTRVNAHGEGGRFRSRKSARRQRRDFVHVSFATYGAYTIEMPARPFLGLDADDREDIPGIVNRHLEKALRR